MSDADDFTGLVKRLRDKKRYEEAMSVLRAAAAFHQAGFDVGFDPKIDGFEKVPDLALTHRRTRERLYVEITGLGTSDIAQAAERTSSAITAEAFGAVPFIHFAGRIHQSLSGPHLEEVVQRVRELVAHGKTEFAELVIPDVLEMGVAPDRDQSFLETWAAARGLMAGSFEGPGFSPDEVKRVRNSIKREGRQLPAEYPNFLIVEGFLPLFDRRPITRIIGEIAESVYDQPHVVAAVIAGGYMGLGQPEARLHDQHAHIRRVRFDVLVDEYLILVNRFCSVPVSPATLSDLYRAYWQS